MWLLLVAWASSQHGGWAARSREEDGGRSQVIFHDLALGACRAASTAFAWLRKPWGPARFPREVKLTWLLCEIETGRTADVSVATFVRYNLRQYSCQVPVTGGWWQRWLREKDHVLHVTTSPSPAWDWAVLWGLQCYSVVKPLPVHCWPWGARCFPNHVWSMNIWSPLGNVLCQI